MELRQEVPVFMQIQEKNLQVEQALMAVMLESAMRFPWLWRKNQCSVKKFVELMNKRARELGCTGTHFNNPNGLPDKNHFTTAADMAKIADAAWHNPLFRKFVTRILYEIPPTNKFGETRYFLNHHKMMEGRDYAYEGVMEERRDIQMMREVLLSHTQKEEKFALLQL